MRIASSLCIQTRFVHNVEANRCGFVFVSHKFHVLTPNDDDEFMMISRNFVCLHVVHIYDYNSVHHRGYPEIELVDTNRKYQPKH